MATYNGMSRYELYGLIDRLEHQVSDLTADQERAGQQHREETNRCETEHRMQLQQVKARASAPFTRSDLDGMPAEQLRSLVEEGINACRRKSMLEAEGLVSRHNELSRETDLEMMRGMVASYTARIKALELDKQKREEQKAAPAKTDTRPLVEKLAPATQSSSWWRNPTSREKQQGYQLFDTRATLITEAVKGPWPGTGNTLKDGAARWVTGDRGIDYKLARSGDVVSCTCPSWEHSTAPADRRTCKHLKRYFGSVAEETRVTRPQPSCYCGILLIRGQCQKHTLDWMGDERCECGRRFDFCKDEQSRGRQLRGVPHIPRLVPNGLTN